MTTIATDGKTMAADGRSVDRGGLICGDVTKIRKLKDGRIAGLAGTPYDIEPFFKWLEDGGECPNFDSEAFEGIVLMPDGKVRSFNSEGRWTLQVIPAGAGSGMDLAIGAMEHGASPREAVEIACRRHSGSGGTIMELSL